MAAYERILLTELGLHHLRMPNELLRPGQVQIRRGGVPFGRFNLEDVFDGDFSAVTTHPPARMADFERTSSDTYAVDASAKLAGPFAWLSRAQGSIAAMGAKHVQLTALSGELTEIDQGALQRALGRASARIDGPLSGNDIAVVVVAVCSAKTFSVRFDDDRGGRVGVDAAMAEGIAGEIGASAQLSKSGGLMLSLESSVPFAARVWRVERKLIGRTLRIGTFRGPVELLGPQGLDPEFADAVGLEHGVLAL